MRLSVLSILGVLSIEAYPAAAVDFTTEVRPILSQHCFKCHGPDESTREGDLRLDVPESAIAPAKSGKRAIVPGDPQASELVARLFTDDTVKVMPPPEAKKTLTEREKQVLREWVAKGAAYKPHWAFERPRLTDPPAVRNTDWPRNAIDPFILARIEAAGLSPAPDADRHTLVRRLYLDLIGLPPTPEEADEFVHDASPRAYENLVDRLLASPHYGERWARRWLDLARYADTNGYEKDRPRSIWPYRDWVIAALNADMPFDRFTIEQIAGDMLPGAGIEHRIATGYHRNTMLNEEGGIDPLEYRFYAMADRVATTGTTWLGLTLGCAQCHTHKYDPVTHSEYYRLMAMMNNTQEPDLEVPDEAVASRRREIHQQIASMEAALPGQFPGGATSLEARFDQWLATERARTVNWETLTPIAATSNLPLLTILADQTVLASGDMTKADTYRVRYRVPTEGGGVTAVRLDALPHDSLPAHGPGRTYYEGRKGDFFLSHFRLRHGGKPVALTSATQSYGKLAIGGGEATAALTLDDIAHSGWSTSGREGEAHHAVYNLAAPLPLPGELELEMVFERHYAAGLGRFRVSITRETSTNPVARDMPERIEQLLRVASNKLTAEQRSKLLAHFCRVAPELEKARKPIDALRKTLPEPTTTLVMSERPAAHPRPTFRHHRGEFLQPRELVEPGVLGVLHPLTPGRPADRLALARWLVDPANPLTARVTVNRAWAAFFGRGIVRTLDDFGLQGDSPTHPQLLDFLALEFFNGGWSSKKLHRLIVTSATYRQSARLTPSLLRADPDNRLLARFPRQRLEAELVRDNLLAVSGLLSRKIGGPSVYPPQPASVTTEGAYGRLEWNVSTGAERYRRGLYTFTKRTAPFAMLGTFDGPSGEACVARRDVSNTPLQALTLLNDPVFVEAAQALGRAAGMTGGGVEARCAAMFRRVLIRPPTPAELSQLIAFFTAQKARFAGTGGGAALVGGHAMTGGDAAALAEQAAWTATARVLLNLDEAITKE